MALNSIRNVRGFFSDYWLGSILGAKKGAGSKLTKAQAEKILWRLTQLRNRVEGFENLNLTRFREQFARPLLGQVFCFNILEHAEETRVRLLTRQAEENAEAKTGAPIAGLYLCPDNDEVENRQPRSTLERFLAEQGLGYGLIITPGLIRLVRRLGDGTKGASFDFSLSSTVETEDIESLSAAYRVLHADNFVTTDGTPRPIEILEAESRKYSARVSEDLKAAVFRSAEILIRGFLEDIQARPEAFSPRPSLLQLRDTALQTLYRLLFILYAEARDERLQRHRLYQKSYSLEQLVDRLLHVPEEELPGNRFGHWLAMQALFRIYDEGLPPTPELENIPPRAGRLFSDKTPEGRMIAKFKLSDRVAGKLVLTLATTNPRRGVGRERISFRELEIEQLGSVYEGLLEYEPRTADQIMVEVAVQGRDFVLTPAELKRLCEQKQLTIKGDAEIVANTDAANLHPDNVEEDESAADSEREEVEEDESEEAAEGDEEDKGVKKGAAAGLIRRLEKDEFYFVPGSARKSSGSFYTREEIVQYLVGKALEGLVENKTPAEIESLRVIDLACGSAHFLVGAARYLGKTLLDAYHRQFKDDPPPDFYPDRPLTEEMRKRWLNEGEAWCKRRIIERCLFGVDLNPTAVQLAQVALWIESLAGDRPLSFFAHHIRPGNSLLGTWLERLHAPPHPSLDDKKGKDQGGLFEVQVKNLIREALDERLLIDKPLPPEIRKDTPGEYEYKTDRLKRADQILENAKLLFDLRSAAAFIPEIWGEWSTLLSTEDVAAHAQKQKWWARFEELCRSDDRAGECQRFFHWELEFPEVFFGDRRGFDVIVGNPPWDKVLPDRKEFYGRNDIFIRALAGNELDQRIRELHDLNPALADKFKTYETRVKTVMQMLRGGGDFPLSEGRTQAAHEDLSKYFADRSIRVARNGGSVSLLLPSVFYNGDGCATLRKSLIEETQILSIFGFENRLKIFPIHSSYKFVCFVCRKQKPAERRFPAIFMRHDVHELLDEKLVQTVTITAEEVEKLSPESYALLEYRGPRDQEIIHKMYRNSVILGADDPAGWLAEMFTDFAHKFIYNAARDKDLWTDPNTGLLFNPQSLLSSPPTDPAQLIQSMAEQGFVPVYEGKHIEQFVYGIKPFRWWLKKELAKAKHGREPIEGEVLLFRETASNTNQRTCIATILPGGSAASHTLSGMLSHGVEPLAAISVLNSFCFDYALRLRTAGTHISFTYMRPMPVPPALVTNSLPRVATICAWDHGIERITELPEHWDSLWAANKAVAKAYGLNASDFEHILNSFPVFARKQSEFYEFLRDRLSTWFQEEGKIVRMPGSDFLPGLEPLPSAAPERKIHKSATDEFKRAVVFTWVVGRSHQQKNRATRLRVGKLIYFIEVDQRSGLFQNFLKQAAGPYDPTLRYKGPEGISVRQNHWLRMVSDTEFVPDAIEKCEKFFGRYFDPQKAEAVLEHFRTYGDEALGRWATVHYAAQELIAKAQPVNVATILSNLEASPEWAHKPDRQEFSQDFIQSTLRGMRFKGWL
jgi:hypothetical protein